MSTHCRVYLHDFIRIAIQRKADGSISRFGRLRLVDVAHMLASAIDSDGLTIPAVKGQVANILAESFPDPEEDDLHWHDKANLAVACLPHVWTHFIMQKFDEADLQFFLDGLQLPMKRPLPLPLVAASAEISSFGLGRGVLFFPFYNISWYF